MIPIQLDTYAQKTDPPKVKVILPQGMGCQVTYWMFLPGQIQTQELLGSSGLCSTKKRFPVLREANRVVEIEKACNLSAFQENKILTLTKVVTWPSLLIHSSGSSPSKCIKFTKSLRNEPRVCLCSKGRLRSGTKSNQCLSHKRDKVPSLSDPLSSHLKS